MDWTFAGADTRGATHGIHPYPAKFIPQIPRALIEALHPGDDTAVLDPFCGSGTTLVEAALKGIPCVGIDLHPLACLVSKVKTTPLRSSLPHAAEEVLRHAIRLDAPVPSIPALDHWFRPSIQRALAALMESIGTVADPDVRDALRVAASSIIVRVSNQESDTRYAAVEKDVDAKGVWRAFRSASKALETALSSTWGASAKQPSVMLFNQDVRTVSPQEIDRRVSLAITSPPYPNAYEYWLYHKYRMYWLGMDPIAVRENEIGARPHYFKTEPHTPEDFERDMGAVLALLAEVMAPGGHACFQVATSVIRGEVVDNAALICRAALRNGFQQVAGMTRNIPEKRKAFNPRNSRIKDEALLVFCWEG